jgi:hypothetical protein
MTKPVVSRATIKKRRLEALFEGRSVIEGQMGLGTRRLRGDMSTPVDITTVQLAYSAADAASGAVRLAVASRTNGIKSRPYSSASSSGSKPRIRNVVTPRSQ